MDAVYGSTIAAPVSFCAGHMPSWTRHPRRIGHYVPHASFRRSDRRPLDTRLRPCGTRSGVTLGLRVTIEPPRAPSVDTTTAHTLCASSERPRHATSSRRASRRHHHLSPLTVSYKKSEDYGGSSPAGASSVKIRKRKLDCREPAYLRLVVSEKHMPGGMWRRNYAPESLLEWDCNFPQGTVQMVSWLLYPKQKIGLTRRD